MIITNLREDIEATNAIRTFRRTKKGMASPRNAICWWKACLVVLSCNIFDPPWVTMSQIQKVLKECSNLDLQMLNGPATTLLRKAVDGKMPHDIRREYSKTLPGLALFLGLSCEWDHNEGGWAAYKFRLKNPTTARTILLSEFPELKELYQLIYQSQKNGVRA